jgi:hypothetical protein
VSWIGACAGQEYVPNWQMPTWPCAVQGWPTCGTLSSVRPLQSSSRPLHDSLSWPGVTFALQMTPFAPSHVVMPVAQMPSRPVWHCTPPPGLPSSTLPSQLSSRPLHVSGAGLAATHCTLPFTQWVVPFLHSPNACATQETPPPGSPSSICLLQLSSRPLQTSGWFAQPPPSEASAPASEAASTPASTGPPPLPPAPPLPSA